MKMFNSTLKHLLLAGVALYDASVSASVLQPTPPMGFNNWSAFMCGLNESLFVETAQAMVEKGLLAAGYNRLNLDDCWSQGSREPNGSLLWNTEKFPRGLPWLTGYLKSLGFDSGIYTDAGINSCGGYPATEQEYERVYGHWHSVLSALERPLIFSESAPAYFAEQDNLTDWYTVMDWVPKYGQLARHSRDTLVWNSTSYWPDITGWDSILFNYGQEVRLARYQKPGYFNDPDFLIVDHFDLSLNEKRSHFAIWASLSAPLIISAYIPAFSADEVAYLTNKDLIAVNQDPLALQATLVSQDGTWDVLTRDLANGDRLLTVINRGNLTASYKVPFQRIGISASAVKVKDLWTGKLSTTSKVVTAVNIPSHGTAVYRISAGYGNLNVIPTGMIFNTASLNVLTYSRQGLAWVASLGSDEQVWQTDEDGTIKGVFDTSKCLTDLGGGKVSLVACSGEKNQRWEYYVTGNLVSLSTGACLAEASGDVVTAKCQFESNGQVLGLPSGIDVIGQ
ncbi:alpha-galactosidase [Botrytis cinerea]